MREALFRFLRRIPLGMYGFIVGFFHLLGFTIAYIFFGDVAMKWFEEDIL